MIIEFIVPERPKQGRASLDVLLGLAKRYLDGKGLETAERNLMSGYDEDISAACTSIGEGVFRRYCGNMIERDRVIEEYKLLGLDVNTIRARPVPRLGYLIRGL